MIDTFSDFVRFKKEDIGRINLNDFSPVDNYGWVLDNDEYQKFSLIEGDTVFVIVCFRNYWGKNYEAFILASNDIRRRHIIKFRDMIHKAMIEMDIDRIHTTSRACEKLDKWHEFLGLTCEGVHRKFMYGIDYKTWSILRGD